MNNNISIKIREIMKNILISLMLFISITSLTYAKVKYCKDFTTQAEAQKYFRMYNAKRLDRDRDGEACECIKGGSSYDKSSCRRWRKKKWEIVILNLVFNKDG